MKVLVCGGRDYTDLPKLCDVLDDMHAKSQITLIIHGAARGANKLASYWAKSRGVEQRAFPADWQKHGKAAGPIRNLQMLEEGQPDLCIAFPTGGPGTRNMIGHAKQKIGVSRVVVI